MMEIPYTYSVLRYVHDPIAGESLNVGILLYVPEDGYVTARLEYRYERLSSAFRDFDGEQFRRVLRSFDQGLELLRTRLAGPALIPAKHPPDAEAIVRMLWPDEDLSLSCGPSFAGVTHHVEAEADALFVRLVSSRAPEAKREERRTDDDVWAAFQPVLIKEHLSRVLEHKKFSTPDFEIEFPHAIKNEAWHPLQPISLDYARADLVQRKATTWLGNALALKDHPELGKFYILLGRPRFAVKSKSAYDKARALLDKMPIPHQLVEENEAEDFAKHLASEMRRHGVEIP